MFKLVLANALQYAYRTVCWFRESIGVESIKCRLLSFLRWFLVVGLLWFEIQGIIISLFVGLEM